LKWAGRVERMRDGKPANRADGQKVEGKRRGRLSLRWEELERVAEEWRTRANDRRN